MTEYCELCLETHVWDECNHQMEYQVADQAYKETWKCKMCGHEEWHFIECGG